MAALSNERGFALVAVMLVLALLAVVVTELAVSIRLEASMVGSYKDGIVVKTGDSDDLVQQGPFLGSRGGQVPRPLHRRVLPSGSVASRAPPSARNG